jgi:hypothetical protein
VVRAIFKGIDMGALKRQFRIHPGVQLVDILFAIIAPRHPAWLVTTKTK